LKFIDEFRGGEQARRLAGAIGRIMAGRASADSRPLTIMEVCGTHTMAVARYGIRGLLPASLRLISGPGCPVCVTPHRWIDHAIALSRRPETTVCTFGDMLRVPGSTSSLERERSKGADVRIVASTLEALSLARENPKRQAVFLGVGFETTIPTVAVSILEARTGGLSNYSVLCGHKLMPPALEALSSGDFKPDGYLCPGHVSAILGSDVYQEVVRNHRIGCVIAGFEPLDILQAILMLARQAAAGRPAVENPYSRAVTREGNARARLVLSQVFEPVDDEWRGLGMIPSSGLRIRPEYSEFDAALRFPVEIEPTLEPAGCVCGSVLRGSVTPAECGLFGSSCTPDNPVGACMVSAEGTCAAYFRYGAGA
jgi:hydrogenase expression/formation protein HypD